MGIFDGLPDPAAPGRAFQMGMRTAQQERQQREVRGALAAYATDPEQVPPEAFATIAQWNPEIAIKIREDQTKRQLAARTADVTRRAAAGDPQAIQELAPIDIDTFLKLDKRQQDHIARGVDYVGQAALAISQLPEEERPAAWDDYARQGIEQGFTELQDEIGRYSPEALQAAIAEAKLTQEAIRLAMPDYQVVPEGGTLVNTRDLSALAAVAQQNAPAQPTSKADYDALEPGAEYIAPDGTRRTKGGAGASRVGGDFLDGL